MVYKYFISCSNFNDLISYKIKYFFVMHISDSGLSLWGYDV